MTSIRPYTPSPPPPAPDPIFALWHHCHGYVYHRFKDEHDAFDWATVHGYHLDGEISEALARRNHLTVTQPPYERSTKNRPSAPEET